MALGEMLKNSLQPRSRALRAGSSTPEQGTTNSRRKKKRLRAAAHAVPVALEHTIRLLHESSDFCPPLKGVVGGLSHVITLVQTLKGNREDAERLYSRADNLLNRLSDLIPDVTKMPNDLLLAINDLDKGIGEISSRMDGYVKKHRVGRSSHGAREKAELAYAKERFDNLVLSFMFGSSVRTEIAVSVVPSAVRLEVDNVVSQAFESIALQVAHASQRPPCKRATPLYASSVLFA